VRHAHSLLVAALLVATPGAQDTAVDPRIRGLDYVLDTYVRDGFVYYRTLRSDRSRLDGFVRSLAAASLDGASRNEQAAFWVNAYNALVLRTVIDHYPIGQRSREYPRGSIRQIPGAFEKTMHRVAGKSVTLDQIEQTVIATFSDPRLFFALGRGAAGGGRLRSEAYTGADLERQLASVAAECPTRSQCVYVDRTANRLLISPIFSWREKDFLAVYADKAEPRFASRSPLERAVLAYLGTGLLTIENEFIEKNEFKVEFAPFDWSLNDLTGGRGR
jgi:Protein of unknown function, DUF547